MNEWSSSQNICNMKECLSFDQLDGMNLSFENFFSQELGKSETNRKSIH